MDHNKKQFVCLSGLPRTGSTLLSAILNQNPDIYSSPLSPMVQILSNYDNILKIIDEKENIVNCENVPNFIRKMIEYIRELKFEEEPDYSLLISYIRAEQNMFSIQKDMKNLKDKVNV